MSVRRPGSLTAGVPHNIVDHVQLLVRLGAVGQERGAGAIRPEGIHLLKEAGLCFGQILKSEKSKGIFLDILLKMAAAILPLKSLL